jgi:hypothetical protein
MQDTLTRIEQVLQQHAADSEAFDGLFAGVDLTRPSVARQVTAMYQRCADFLVEASDLKRETSAALDACSSTTRPDLAELHRQLAEFLTALRKHREEEMDVVLESITTEIGAGD